MMNSKPASTTHYDVAIIGGGISGMYAIHKLRQLGMTMRAFEAGSDVGGTWYWNRYPGARFDSESYTYGYSFSDELLDEWEWSEHFAGQPETLRYLNFVADKFDLRKDMQFDTRVVAATFDEENKLWDVELDDGSHANARFLLSCVGLLSDPFTPEFEGAKNFKGQSWHTALWPHEEVDLSGKKVAVIGAGSTAVQVITELSKVVDKLSVFQRTPNYCAPLGNSPIDEDTQKWIKANYTEILQRCKETFGSFLYDFDPRAAVDVSAEERNAFLEEKWSQPGFGIWLGNFHDMISNRESNDLISEFVREKIRLRIDDPEMARKLVPTTHGFGIKRIPLESGYYESYNRDNVELIALTEEPIECITETGIQTSQKHVDVDVIIYATGFDAVTGAYNKIDIRGVGGQKLTDKWANGPRTYLGMQSTDFPNMFTVLGPHNGGTFCNIPRCIEQNIDWVMDAIEYMRDNDFKKISVDPAAEDAWTEHVYELVNATLIPETKTWFSGDNIEGKPKSFLLYTGGSVSYRKSCDDVAENGYEGFVLER
tara:strand:+ start:1116 stop:2735 length:1620 start_codon:yes stop_codon:yes gene_type:complete